MRGSFVYSRYPDRNAPLLKGRNVSFLKSSPVGNEEKMAMPRSTNKMLRSRGEGGGGGGGL